MTAVTVVIPAIPTRYKNKLNDAIDSVRQQTAEAIVEIIVGYDAGGEMPFCIELCVPAANQSAKINAAIANASHPVIAILHDDDLWHPHFLKAALSALENADFVSSTSLATDEDGAVIGVQDCPVPSGWVFTKALFERVGPWAEDYRFHPDSEWLGRLGEMNEVKRAHLIEAFAPSPRIRIGDERRYNQLVQRPGMAAFLAQAKPAPALVRHDQAVPLVNHRQAADGIMQRINEPERWMASQFEYQRMTERFGRIPW